MIAKSTFLVLGVVLGFALVVAGAQGAYSPGFKVIRGNFVIEGKQPDGDSVRFVADNAALYQSLRFGSRVRPSRDGSVQLRFEAIDAPEAHYAGQEQPLGRESRDALLATMGFKNVVFEKNDLNVSSAKPASVRGAILSQAVETNGRPVSYVFLDSDIAALRLKDGASITVTEAMLARTLNTRQLEGGWAYTTLYSSTPATHQRFFVGLAQKARAAKRGVWASDKTNAFDLKDAASLGRDGALVLPKLFRRAITFLNAKAKDPSITNVQAWMVSTQNTRNQEDDMVVYQNRRVRFSSLLGVDGTRVMLKADPLELVFVEK